MNIDECPPDYTVLRKLGQGAFGAVHMVMKLSTNVVRAMKRYNNWELARNPKLAEKIEDEIKTMQKVDNEHVLKIYEVIKSPKYTNLILDFCDGGDLSGLLQARKQVMAEGELKPIFFDLLKGFRALKFHEIIHRDIKPENLLMKNGKAVIGDFGVCKFGVQKTGTVVGNKCTIAPEIRQVQMGDLDKYDFKVDVWSLGVTLYMLLVGRDPWNFADVFTNYAPINTTKLDYSKNSGNNLPFPADIPISESLKGILRRMISIEPEERPDWTCLQNEKFFDAFRVAQVAPTIDQPYHTVLIRPDYPVQPGSPLVGNQNSSIPGSPNQPNSNIFGGVTGIQNTGSPLLVNNHHNPLDTQAVVTTFIIPPDFVKDTPFEYFRHNNQVALYLCNTAQLLRNPSKIKDTTVKNLMLGCAACAQLIGVGVIKASLDLLDSESQPKGIQTAFGGAGQFYGGFLAEGTREELIPTHGRAVDGAFDLFPQLQQVSSSVLSDKQQLLQWLEGCVDGVPDQRVLSVCKKVAHVLSQEIKKHQNDQTQYPEMKTLLVRIYLCLTYQQAMEFRDREKNVFNWDNFNEDLKSNYLTNFYWKDLENYLISPF